jgi:hypothetical protein
MTEWEPARNGLLLQTLENALAFFATEGSERPFRSECHIFHLRGSGTPQAMLPKVAKANEPSAPDQQQLQL